MKVQYEVIISKVGMKCVKILCPKSGNRIDLSVYAMLELGRGGSERVTPRIR